MDRHRLNPGDDWKHVVLSHIRRNVQLFIPIISQNTEGASRGFVFAEWQEAEERSRSIPRNRSFIVPVVIDASVADTDRYRQIPDRFRDFDFGHAPAGIPDDRLLGTLRKEIRKMRVDPDIV
jgi:hypothetical protein